MSPLLKTLQSLSLAFEINSTFVKMDSICHICPLPLSSLIFSGVPSAENESVSLGKSHRVDLPQFPKYQSLDWMQCKHPGN